MRPIEACELAAEPAGLARSLRQRQPDTRRRRSADSRVSAGGDGEADGRQAEHQFVRLLAHRQAAALAYRVAHVAEHEQIAERGAGKTGRIGRLAADEAIGEALHRGGRARGLRDGDVDLLAPVVVERDVPGVGQIDEALGEIGVLGGERLVDAVRGDIGVEFLVQHAVGDADRIGLAGQRVAGVPAVRHQPQPQPREQRGRQQHGSDARAAHERFSLHLGWRESIRVAHGYPSIRGVRESPPGDNPNPAA